MRLLSCATAESPHQHKNAQVMKKPKEIRDEPSSQEERLTKAVMNYLAEHPEASDTLEGIAEWCIMRQSVRVEVNSLVRVLRRLLKKGLLNKRGEGDDALYFLTDKDHSNLQQ